MSVVKPPKPKAPEPPENEETPRPDHHFSSLRYIAGVPGATPAIREPENVLPGAMGHHHPRDVT
ncbi:hypothetical protein JOF33_002428 [Corynebacterium freneyi]|uniref:Uncharacterized protein n=1 Tax=Corynebacterium freneyi TaxID=134034 RepID=A0ABS4UAY4_9CORY|nr:hypothetical protein [Corynebacterium freneyi]WJZ04169.1 hypothetical protein CFREN_00880 [Corynebacterium freneyi]